MLFWSRILMLCCAIALLTDAIVPRFYGRLPVLPLDSPLGLFSIGALIVFLIDLRVWDRIKEKESITQRFVRVWFWLVIPFAIPFVPLLYPSVAGSRVKYESGYIIEFWTNFFDEQTIHVYEDKPLGKLVLITYSVEEVEGNAFREMKLIDEGDAFRLELPFQKGKRTFPKG